MAVEGPRRAGASQIDRIAEPTAMSSAAPQSRPVDVVTAAIDPSTLPTNRRSEVPSSPQSIVGIRGSLRGDVKGLRALRAATGLEGYVPLEHLRALDKVRRQTKRTDAMVTPALVRRFASLGGLVAAGRLERALPELLAIASTICERTLGHKPRDEQLLTAIAMIRGAAVQLPTGEGKTLAVGLAAAVIALKQEGVHVLTANDYLAERDSKNLAPLFDALELSVGLVSNDFTATRYDDKRAAYRADITYGDVNAVAFDWLEDQTWWKKASRVMRGLPTALVDEMDHVMLDTAMKPLVLSRAADAAEVPVDTMLLERARRIVDRLGEDAIGVYREGDHPKPFLTDPGIRQAETLIRETLGLTPDASIWEVENLPILHEINLALEAKYAVREGYDYVRSNDDIILIDGTTGRPNPAGRLRHGLHNAVRVREGLAPEPPMVPIAMGSYLHFFRAYDALSGTTATADRTGEELRTLHALPLVRIPTHRNIQRVDFPDRVFVHPDLRDAAVVADLIGRHERNQPVLVSTASVAASKRISARVADPLSAIAAAACSSASVLRTAAGILDDAEDLLDRADLHEDGVRASLAASMTERMRDDPDGTAKFVSWLADNGLDLTPLLAYPTGLPHRVLNAENHTAEATVVERAGSGGAVMIATQMAGRGVHIDVPDDVLGLGGLHVIGVERKTSARQDMQLVGRSGRCGAAGSSQFFLSPADDFLEHLAAVDRRALAKRLEGEKPELSGGLRRFLFSRAASHAQRSAEAKAESMRFIEARLDEAVEKQRASIQSFRDNVIDHDDPLELILTWLDGWMEQDEPMVRERFGLAPSDSLSDVLRARLDDKEYLRDLILFHVDKAWVAQLETHEFMRSTAIMRTQFNTWAENMRDSTDSFIAMSAHIQEQVVDRLVFHLANPEHGAH